MSKPASSREAPAYALPDHWMTRIFTVLRATYGVAFDRQWECPPDQEPTAFANQLRALWAAELVAFANKPDAIAFALQHLPVKPPNLVEFRALCRAAPAPVVAALSHTPARVESVTSGLSRANAVTEQLRRGGAGQRQGWVEVLRRRIAGGYRPTMDQVRALAEVGVTVERRP